MISNAGRIVGYENFAGVAPFITLTDPVLEKVKNGINKILDITGKPRNQKKHRSKALMHQDHLFSRRMR